MVGCPLVWGLHRFNSGLTNDLELGVPLRGQALLASLTEPAPRFRPIRVTILHATPTNTDLAGTLGQTHPWTGPGYAPAGL
jgi:hypothetical protein